MHTWMNEWRPLLWFEWKMRAGSVDLAPVCLRDRLLTSLLLSIKAPPLFLSDSHVNRWKAWLSTCLTSTRTASPGEAASPTDSRTTSPPLSPWLQPRSGPSLSSSIRWGTQWWKYILPLHFSVRLQLIPPQNCTCAPSVLLGRVSVLQTTGSRWC